VLRRYLLSLQNLQHILRVLRQLGGGHCHHVGLLALHGDEDHIARLRTRTHSRTHSDRLATPCALRHTTRSEFHHHTPHRVWTHTGRAHHPPWNRCHPLRTVGAAHRQPGTPPLPRQRHVVFPIWLGLVELLVPQVCWRPMQGIDQVGDGQHDVSVRWVRLCGDTCWRGSTSRSPRVH
jgi:hypothetical protein